MSAFPEISKIPYEGPSSKNPLAFRYYNADEVVEGKTMKDHLRFSVVYWHTFRGTGSDPFGPGTMRAPLGRRHRLGRERHATASGWRSSSSRSSARRSTASTIATSPPKARRWPRRNKNLDAVVKVLKEEQQRTGIKLLWGTANLFSNPRYMHGAATSCNADVFAYAAAQVKKALEVTKELGGENYVFWGGREGYQNLWNTDMKRELDHLARFMHMAVDYAKEIGFTGQFLYRAQAQGADQAPVRLRRRRLPQLPAGLRSGRPLQAEHRNQPRHAGRPHDDARAGVRRHAGLARLDRRQHGRPAAGLGHRPVPHRHLPHHRSACWSILKYGGLAPGGVNFDAKVRRESFEPIDLFYAHIGGMDAFARGLKIAAAIRADGKLAADRQGALQLVGQRHRRRDRSRQASFASLEKYMLDKGEITPNHSGRQEMIENLINTYL